MSIEVHSTLGRTHVLQNASELPDPSRMREIYMDFETTHFGNIGERTGNDRNMAVRPYSGDRICGAAFTWDDNPDAFYVPMRHTTEQWNLPLDSVRSWLKDAVTRPERWINHNVKFDAHFAAQDEAVFDCELLDTMVMAKMIHSDRWSHDLKPLMREWLDLETETQDEVTSWLKGAKSHDYARVPADILGRYAGDDVLAARKLRHFCEEKLPEAVRNVWNTEVALTPVLWDVEHRGFRVDKQQLRFELMNSLRLMIKASERIEELTDREFTNSSACIHDILCVQFGLPVLAYTKKTPTGGGGGPSFDKGALALYSIHPQVTSRPEVSEVVQLISSYRAESTFKGLFLESFLERADENDRVHSSYNQVIRTGRMSCKAPNSQQLNKRAKALVLPDPGFMFLDADASQIEFRITVHYIQDQDAIDAYRNDPDTDFHQWVAELCHIERSPAKNVNFAMDFGAGKRKVMSMLRNDPSIMAEIGKLVQDMFESGEIPESAMNRKYHALVTERAAQIYEEYHEKLPGIRRTSDEAQRIAKITGFVFNAFGRRRHLDKRGSRKAFNSIIQSTAMDFIKDRIVAIAPRYNLWTRDKGLEILANVHDSILFQAPTEVVQDPAVRARVKEILETQTQEFAVPFMWKTNYSEKSWAEAAA